LHKFIRSLDVEFVEDPSHHNRPEEIDVLVCMAHLAEIQNGSAELLMCILVDGERVISGLPGDGHVKNSGLT
jgi:hypothetical protein